MRVAGVKKKPPKLYDDLVDVWEGFLALNSSRIGVNPVAFSEIESWLNLSWICGIEKRQEMAYLIKVLDNEYLQFMRDKRAHA